ncbi:MAG: hypothetical protein AB1345_10395 [Chloroflexota bacterium]
MGWFKKIARLFFADKQGISGYWLTVRCDRCGEVIRTRLNLSSDLSIRYEEGTDKISYFCRKTLMGSKRCFQRIEVELTFDDQRRLMDGQIVGGQFVSEKETFH